MHYQYQCVGTRSALSEAHGLKILQLFSQRLISPLKEYALRLISRAFLPTFVLTCLAAATPAFADTYDFSLTDGASGNVYTWTLPESPTVTNSSSSYFEVSPVDISVNGNPPVSTNDYFFNITVGAGGLGISGAFNFNDTDSTQNIFSGPTTAPTF